MMMYVERCLKEKGEKEREGLAAFGGLNRLSKHEDIPAKRREWQVQATTVMRVRKSSRAALAGCSRYDLHSGTSSCRGLAPH